MRKLVISLLTINAAASAAAWSPRDVKSAVRVAWDWPIAWRGSPAAAEAPKAIPGENGAEGRGRGVVQMLSGAVLLFILGGRLAWTAIYAGFEILNRDLYFPDGEEDDVVEDDEFFAVWRTGVYEHRLSEFHPVRGWDDVKPHEVRGWAPIDILDVNLGTFLVPDGCDASDASDDELEL